MTYFTEFVVLRCRDILVKVKKFFINYRQKILQPYKRGNIPLIAAILVFFIAITFFTVNFLQKEDTNYQSNAQSVPSNLYGTYWNGDSLANLEVGGQNGGSDGRSVSYRFRAEASGSMTGAQILFAFNSGYYMGDGGDIRMDVQSDDGTSNHFPSGTTLRSSNVVTDPLSSNYRTFSLTSPLSLTAGTLYHLVFVNVHPNRASNYTSLDMLDPGESNPMQPGYSDTDLAVVWKSSGSAAWALNGSKTPIFTIHHQDGTHHGPGSQYEDARSVSSRRSIAGTSQIQETFTVSGGNKTVSNVSARLLKTGTPGALTVRLENSSGTLIEQGTIPASSVSTSARWVTYTFTTPRTLTNGQSYNLVLSAPSGNAYETWPLSQGTASGFDAPNAFSDGYFQYTTNGSTWTSESIGDMQMYFTLSMPSTATLTASPATVPAGGTTTVSWSGVSSPTVADWVGLYASGAADTSYLDWKYTSSCNQTAGATAQSSGSCSFTMPTTTGNHEFRLFANDGYTKLATSNTVTVSAPDTTPPTVSITAPANGSTVSGTATTVSANASDNVGVTGVQFKLDGANLNTEDTTSPYSISWNTTTATNGSHTLTAVARDAAGNTTTSTGVSVTVSNAAPQPSGPIAHWKLDETFGTTASDSSGNGRNGALAGAPAWTTGKIVGALNFDGIDDSLSATVSDSGLGTKLSFSQWVNATSFVAYGGVIGNFSDGGSDGIRITSNSNGSYSVSFRNSTGAYTECTTASGVSTGIWNHLAATYENGTARLYLNGSLSVSCTGDTTITNLANFKVGYNIDHGAFFKGKIDDVRIYNRVLTAQEVTDLYNAAPSSTPSPTPTPTPASDTTPPSVPTGLTATPVSSSQINLSWTASTDNVGVTGYRVERCQGSSCTNFVQIATPNGTSYSNTGLSRNTTYRYRVRAVDAAGNLSGYSAIASAKTRFF